ncbi:kelch-like protein diablo [Elysia marginata]|uniref:Kelch-like protein diablo n=1 Tax=Elysia marginata TaxID=1093978 RepID=A0AAV4ET15_9GAST|nr:kelch-like protein diablo [Elysia marginata]
MNRYFLPVSCTELQPLNSFQDIDEMAMELLIEFCYTSSITVEESNVQTLLPAACLLQLVEIQDVCCEFLKRQLDPSNCLGIRAFADTHACRDLLRIADKFTQHNFQEVMESEEFMLLPVNQLVDIICSEELNVRTEEQVYNAIMGWVKYNVQERRQHLPTVKTATAASPDFVGRLSLRYRVYKNPDTLGMPNLSNL